MDLLLRIGNGTLAITAVLTGIGLVFAALLIAKLIAPRSFSSKKADPYECGIPTRGDSMVQFKAGYYIFAILFLIFDATITKGLGTQGLLCIGIFLLVLVLGLAYAWRKGALKWQ